MELGAHHVVVVARQYGQAVPGLPVPDPDSLRIEILQMTKLHVCPLQEHSRAEISILHPDPVDP